MQYTGCHAQCWHHAICSAVPLEIITGSYFSFSAVQIGVAPAWFLKAPCQCKVGTAAKILSPAIYQSSLNMIKNLKMSGFCKTDVDQ